jgi:hypothetical protein
MWEKGVRWVMLHSKDLFQVIEEDHGTISRILEQIEDCGPYAATKRLRLLSELKRLLPQQLLLERDSLYLPLRTFPKLRASVTAAFHEQRLVENALEELASTPIGSSQWSKRFENLLEDVEFHFSMEEADLFQRVKKVIPSGDLKRMVRNYRQKRSKDAKELSAA